MITTAPDCYADAIEICLLKLSNASFVLAKETKGNEKAELAVITLREGIAGLEVIKELLDYSSGGLLVQGQKAGN